MTNEELIMRFFKGKGKGDEESYGFSIKFSKYLKRYVGELALYSKTSQFPFATKAPKNHFLVTTPLVGSNNKNCDEHTKLVIGVAKELEIKFVLSPLADKNHFQTYMKKKINNKLTILARGLKAKSSRVNFDYYPPYLELVEAILTLHEGEDLLKLPENQVSLLDTDDVQNAWHWLIKENPHEEEQKLLMRTYTLSRLLAPK